MEGKTIARAPDKISRLYLGDLEHARDTKTLKALGITHVLTLGNFGLDYSEKFVWKHIDIEDVPESNLLQHFDTCIKFIHSGREEGIVFVHCLAGMSRSVSTIAAYLMKETGRNVARSLQLIQRKRGRIKPNPGFREQLETYETKVHDS